jgi:hypothetical protein
VKGEGTSILTCRDERKKVAKRSTRRTDSQFPPKYSHNWTNGIEQLLKLIKSPLKKKKTIGGVLVGKSSVLN